MANDIIEYELNLDRMLTGTDERELESRRVNGLHWSCKYSTDYSAVKKSERYVYLSWVFDWEELRSQGVEALEGTITAIYKNQSGHWISNTFHVNLEDSSGETIEKRIETVEKCRSSHNIRQFKYKFTLTKVRKNQEEARKLARNFERSQFTDAVLVVEHMKMHVNKAFLAFHSKFFQTLFFSDFKEKSMEEIPIENVCYEDFARLLSVVLPDPIFASDRNVETLLDLADRFMMPSVTRHVEHHLLVDSKFRRLSTISFAEKLLELSERFNLPNIKEDVETRLLNDSELKFYPVWMIAERFKLKKVKEQIISWISENEHMGLIRNSPEYNEMPDSLKVKLFERMVEINKPIVEVVVNEYGMRHEFEYESDDD